MIKPFIIAMTFALAPSLPVAASAASAQAAPAAAAVVPLPALRERVGQLITLLNGAGDSAALFAPAFLAQVPDAKVRAIAGQLHDGLGKAVSVAAVDAVQPNAARIRIAYERGVVSMNLAVEPAAPNRIIGLLITGTSTQEASLDAVVAALKAEPGITGFTLARLGDARAGGDAVARCQSASGDRLGVQARHPRRVDPRDQ